jgi:ATP:ADP antiporter, AAA family
VNALLTISRYHLIIARSTVARVARVARICDVVARLVARLVARGARTNTRHDLYRRRDRRRAESIALVDDLIPVKPNPLARLAAAVRRFRRNPESAVALWAGFTFGALMSSHFAIRPVRDTLFSELDGEQIPWLFTASFIVVCVASSLWSALLARRSRRSVVPVAYHLFALCLVGFFFAVHSGLAKVTVGYVFYVWSAVFNLFVVSVFWSLLADLLGPGAARRLYGPIAAGGTVGTFVGPGLTKLLHGTIGEAGVLLMSAVLLELAVLGMRQVRRAAASLPRTDAEPDEPDVPAGGGAFTGIAHVFRSRYLSALAGYVLCMACASTFVYLAQATIVQDAIAGRAARTSFFASLELYEAGVTLVLQLFVAAPALGWLGPAVVLSILPVIQVAGISMLTLAPSLVVLSIVRVAGRSVQHGLIRPARELLFTVVSRDDKYRAKHAIDTVAYRFSDFASSWLRKGLVALSVTSGVLVGALPLIAIWLGLAAALGRGFRRRVSTETPNAG